MTRITWNVAQEDIAEGIRSSHLKPPTDADFQWENTFGGPMNQTRRGPGSSVKWYSRPGPHSHGESLFDESKLLRIRHVCQRFAIVLRSQCSTWMTISRGFRPSQPFLGRIDHRAARLRVLRRVLLMGNRQQGSPRLQIPRPLDLASPMLRILRERNDNG